MPLKYVQAHALGRKTESEPGLMEQALESISKSAGSQKQTPKVARVIRDLGLVRVAGNVWECPSTKDFWAVRGASIIRLTGKDPVDNGETIAAADVSDPETTLNEIMADLEF